MQITRIPHVKLPSRLSRRQLCRCAETRYFAANLAVDAQEGQKHTPFFFEPTLKKILGFFETQMFSSVLKQVVDESELSRLASRIKSMEDSLGTIEKEQDILHKTELRAKRMIENNKQLQRLSGIALWQAR